jgi:hypothetical protein
MNAEFVLEHFFLSIYVFKMYKRNVKTQQNGPILIKQIQGGGPFKVFIFLCLWPEGVREG